MIDTKPILIIDPGHGGKDIGGGSNDIFKEKEMNLKISLYQYQRFQELNVPVHITRDSDIYLSPTTRTEIVRESGAIYCISNHLNAYKPEARGVETIRSIFADDALARKLFQAIVGEGMLGRRVFSKVGDSGKDYYFMHRDTGSVETVIIEYGFATNKQDTELIVNNWQGFAEAVVKAFCEYIGHPYSVPKEVLAKNSEKEETVIIQPEQPVKTGYPSNTPDWKINAVNWLYSQNLLTKQSWKGKVDEPLPLWAVATMLQRLKSQLEK